MRNPLLKIATLAVAAGALLIPAVPASATAMDDPFAVFDVQVKATKKAKPGGKVTYSIVATNKGPHYADYYFVGGEFPKHIDFRKIKYSSSVKDTECALDGRAFYCFVPQVVEKGDSIGLTFYTNLTKKAKGTQTAKLGVVTYDVQTGMEDMSKEELDRLGVPEHGYVKTVKTKVVR
jgi:Domain of unknown function DUF11